MRLSNYEPITGADKQLIYVYLAFGCFLVCPSMTTLRTAIHSPSFTAVAKAGFCILITVCLFYVPYRTIFVNRRYAAGRCPKCGHLLMGLTERQCPECGRSFTFEEVRRKPEQLQFAGPLDESKPPLSGDPTA